MTSAQRPLMCVDRGMEKHISELLEFMIENIFIVTTILFQGQPGFLVIVILRDLCNFFVLLNRYSKSSLVAPYACGLA